MTKSYKEHKRSRVWIIVKPKTTMILVFTIVYMLFLNGTRLLLKAFGYVSPHLIDISFSINPFHQVLLFEMLNDWHGRVHVGDEAFLQRLVVVVTPARSGRSSSQTPFQAHLFTAVEKYNKFKVDLVSHGCSPAGQIVLVAREPVNQKVMLVRLVHGPLKQGTCDGNGNNGTVGHVVLNKLSILRSGIVSLGPQQLAGGQVHKSKVLYNFGTLRAFSGARSSEDEHNVWLGHFPRDQSCK